MGAGCGVSRERNEELAPHPASLWEGGGFCELASKIRRERKVWHDEQRLPLSQKSEIFASSHLCPVGMTRGAKGAREGALAAQPYKNIVGRGLAPAAYPNP